MTNWFGGASNASTQLLDGMHSRGLLRISGRVGGVRTYAACEVPRETCDSDTVLDALVDIAVHKYAPLPERTLGDLVSRLRHCAPQWAQGRRAALVRAKMRLPHAAVGGVNWVWPEGENPASKDHSVPDVLRMLAPFDPVVWDRRRFELFWGWAYRFEAYTPAPKRQRGYYALPLLWREQVVGWANLSVLDGQLQAQLGFAQGYAHKRPRDKAFNAALDDDLQDMSRFLALV